MRGVQRLKPEMDQIRERHAGDRQRMNEEMMALYQRHKVNPASSCLPIVLPIPFFISLFYLLRSPEFKADVQRRTSCSMNVCVCVCVMVCVCVCVCVVS